MTLLSICLVFVSMNGAYFDRTGGRSVALVQASDEVERLAGTWVLDKRDGSTSQMIRLVLRRDGSYTKALDAIVNGSRYGGTHSGSWTARGTVVRLSGDGNWPAYSHDLGEFRKVE